MSNGTGTITDTPLSDSSTSPPTERDNSTQANATPAPPEDRAKAIHNAFSLGWQMFELRSRVGIAAIEYEPPVAGPRDMTGSLTEHNGSLQLASMWRAMFGRIADLHAEAFPDGATAKTLYVPPVARNVPYLHPSYMDYADVGIKGEKEPGKPILDKFGLFDVTRRAINCLTLLYTDKEESLIPELIANEQARLIRSIVTAPIDLPLDKSVIDAVTGKQADPADTETDVADKETGPAGPEILSQTDIDAWMPKIRDAIEKLSQKTVTFLDAWDGYIRENFYASNTASNEARLISYEAGRSLAALCWGMSVKLTPLERAGETNEARYKLSWDTFNDRAIIKIQHQISAISTALDDAYYTQPGKKRPVDGAVQTDPDVPSQAINAVKHSLDYWLRAVKYITSPDTAISWQRRLQIRGSNLRKTLPATHRRMSPRFRRTPRRMPPRLRRAFSPTPALSPARRPPADRCGSR